MFRALFRNILTLAAFMLGLAGPVAAQETKDADTKKGGGDLDDRSDQPCGFSDPVAVAGSLHPEFSQL